MKPPQLEWNEIAQAYCTKRNSHKIVDPELLMDICDVAQAIFEKWFNENKCEHDCLECGEKLVNEATAKLGW